MIVAITIPRFPLLVALLRARRAADRPMALGPAPGAAQEVGLCTPAAAAHGVHEGLRIGEALARCPDLELVEPDPEAVDDAAERLLGRLEDLGAAVEPLGGGEARFRADGLIRLHGGGDRLLRRVRAALPVGADGRIGRAAGAFTAVQAAREAPSGRPLEIPAGGEATFLAPLPVDRLPLDAHAIRDLRELGVGTVGELAALPGRAVLDRLGARGHRAWRLAGGHDDEPVLARRPPQPVQASFRFPEPVGAREALAVAARSILGELVTAIGRGRSPRSLTVRVRTSGDGSFACVRTLREPTSDPDRLALAIMPALDAIVAPVEEMTIRADASGPASGHQLTAVPTGAEERRARTGQAVRHVRAALGSEGVMRVVELEPWTRLPERRWALVPFDV